MLVRCRLVARVVVAGLVISSSALAQSGGLNGVVRDANGAVGAFSIAPIKDGEYLIEVIAGRRWQSIDPKWAEPRDSVLAGPATAQSPSKPGVLLLAHGGNQEWNARVAEVATAVDAARPTEVAFGMASRSSIQAAVDRLTARGVTEIVAVPLFVSSWSSVITSTEYLFGVRAEAPADLAMFARMNHGPTTTASTLDHNAHDVADPLARVSTKLSIRMAEAFNHHPLIGEVVIDRARSLSRSPRSEAVILVAHGPVPDDDNQRWLGDMRFLAKQLEGAIPFAAVEYLTVRDDAGPAMREAATQELRSLVQRHAAAGRRVLIVPHVLSFGGIEAGLRKRLEGLEYQMATQGLVPDPRIAQWVLSKLR